MEDSEALKDLKRIRSKFVDARRREAEYIRTYSDDDTAGAGYFSDVLRVQEAIEKLDRAIADEEKLSREAGDGKASVLNPPKRGSTNFL